MRRTEAIVLSAILLVASLLSFWDPGAYVFEMDPAELSARGREIASGDALPLAGPNVASGEAGRWMGPLTYYVAALPFFFVSEIELAALFFGAILVGAVALIWSIARALFNPSVGLAAAALFASSAHVAIEQRLNFLTAIAPFLLLALLRACIAWGPFGRPRSVIAVIALAGALTQLHVVHVAFFVLVVFAWWRWRPPLDKKAAAIGCAIVLALQLPWGVEQLLSGGRDVERFVNWLSGLGESERTFDASAALRTLVAALSAPFRIPLDLLEEQGGAPSLGERAGLAALAALTLAGALLGPIERRWRPALQLVAVWLCVPLALFVIGSNGVYSFHMISILPGFMLVAAVGAERLTSRLSRWRGWALGVAIVALMVPQVSVLFNIAGRVEEQGHIRLPMSMILSHPDDLWRIPVDIEFPTLRDVRHVESLLAAHGLPPDVQGRVHGPRALALAHFPPYLPAFSGGVDDVGVPPDAQHWILERGDPCRAAARADRAGPHCLLRAEPPSLFADWRVDFEGAERPIGFPARSDTGRIFRRQLPPDRPLILVLWTLGPTPTRMDRPTAPALEVTLDGAALEPIETRIDVPFWVLAERRYLVQRGGLLVIRPLSDERHSIDIAFADP